MGFILLLLISSLSIAGSAAFFSVYGLARIFSGAFFPVILMASSLEAGKLVAASFLYRFWNKITVVMRALMTTTVIGLMVITSLGIFGFLSNANNTTLIPFEQQQSQITTLQSHITDVQQLKTERLAREDQINKQIANLPDNFVNGRKRLMAANQDELQQITKDVADYTKDILDTQTKIAIAKSQSIQTASDVGPIVYIAKAFNIDITTATKYLIFLIMFVFDPLAVMLTIAANIAIVDRKNQSSLILPERKLPPTPSIDEAKTIPIEQPIPSIQLPNKITPVPWIAKDGSVNTHVPFRTTLAGTTSADWSNLIYPNGMLAPKFTGAQSAPADTKTYWIGGDSKISDSPIIESPNTSQTIIDEQIDEQPKPISQLTDDEIRAELDALSEPKTKEEIEYKTALDRILHRVK